MAQALGVRFYNNQNQVIEQPMTGHLMGQVARIDLRGILPQIKECPITVACDVANPLLGINGATRVYSPQKGANPRQLDQLEANMEHVIGIIEQAVGTRVRNLPGAGAAGGLGAGFMAFFGAKTKPGIEIVMETVGFHERIKGADLILTGEGKVDAQTAFGKTISGVLKAAGQNDIPVIILAGGVEEDADALFDLGATSIFSICSKPMALEEAMRNAGSLLESATHRLIRILA
jgi:glycerate 2-kinase